MVPRPNAPLQRRAQALVDHVLDLTRDPVVPDPRLVELRLRVLELGRPTTTHCAQEAVPNSVVVVIN